MKFKDVSIERERYEQLLDCETRLSILYNFLESNTYVGTKDILIILGYPNLAKNLEKNFIDLPGLKEDDLKIIWEGEDESETETDNS